MLKLEEKLVFEAFYETVPEFSGRPVSWSPGNNPPDVLCVASDGTRIGVELGEWLNEEQMKSSVEQERLEKSYLDAIQSQDSLPPENIGMVWVITKIRLEKCDAAEFRTQIYALITSIDANWSALDYHDSPQGFAFKDFSQYPALSKYLQALRFYPRSRCNRPPRYRWIGFPNRGGAYSPQTALDALSTILAKKAGKYAGLHQQERLDELYLVVYYNKALLHNTPFQIPGFGFREIARCAIPFLEGNHGVFQKVFLFNAIKGDQEATLVWPAA